MFNLEWLNLHQLLIIIVVITLAKLYFRGTSCKIRRDLNGKVAVITGGNAGIGKETMLDLARNGCTVIMGARDKAKSEQVVKLVIKETGNSNVEYVPLDLGSKQSIQEFVRTVTGKHPNIDFLINNAGVMFITTRTLTRDGFEMQMGINHLGHFYLTSLLWDHLKNSRDLRIVNVASLAHSLVTPWIFGKIDLDFDNLNSQKKYNAALVYSRTKLANILFTNELAKRVEKVNPTARVVSLHPGVVRTQLLRYLRKGILDFLYMLAEPIYWIFSKSPKEGAQTSLYTIYEKAENLVNGAYYSDCAVKQPTKEARNPETAAKLWEVSERLLNHPFKV